MRASFETSWYECYFVHRQVYIYEQPIWLESFTNLNLIQILIFHFEGASRFSISGIQLKCLGKGVIGFDIAYGWNSLRNPVVIKLFRIGWYQLSNSSKRKLKFFDKFTVIFLNAFLENSHLIFGLFGLFQLYFVLSNAQYFFSRCWYFESADFFNLFIGLDNFV